MRIAILGARGQLGTALRMILGPRAVPIARSDVDLDLSEPAAIMAALRAAEPEAVINAAAYNLVDRAEDEPEVAFRHNALGPRRLAQCCAELNLPLMHVSTDHVFGLDAQRHRPYGEGEAPSPASAYAVSKLAGEDFVRAHGEKWYVVRTCGLYGRAESAGKGNFVTTMLRLGRERGEVRVVDDQVCTPTSTAELAAQMIGLIETGAYGTYHATCAGEMSWCAFAREIFRQAEVPARVIPISTREFNARARRPAYSVLDCSKLAQVIGREPLPWEEALSAYLADILPVAEPTLSKAT